MNREKIRWLAYLLLPLPGLAFSIDYIKRAGANVAYSDYIRIIYSYLPNVFDIRKFLVPDILTRAPINYLERMVNVVFFHFDTRFDMVLGAICLAAAAWVLGWYCYKKRLHMVWYLLILVLMFSLNKWEMLLNGTGWVHFLAFACFYYYFILVDRAMIRKEAKKHDYLLLKALPFLLVFTVTGNYCASPYAVVVLLYIGCAIRDRRASGKWDGRYLSYILCNVLPVVLFLISSLFVDEPPVGVATGSIFPYLIRDPMFFLLFLVKSFGTMVIGEETAKYWNVEAGQSLSENQMVFLGCLVIAFYLAALWVYWRKRLYKVSWLPLLLMLSGGFNHILVMSARWRFLKEDYGMSSRYALQFQVGLFGILLTFALASKQWSRWKARERVATLCLSVVICATLIGGNLVTTASESSRAHYREEYFDSLFDLAHRFDQVPDQELAQKFQYGRYPKKVRQALQILRDNHLNMFVEK